MFQMERVEDGTESTWRSVCLYEGCAGPWRGRPGVLSYDVAFLIGKAHADWHRNGQGVQPGETPPGHGHRAGGRASVP